MNTYNVLIAEDEGLIAMDIAGRLEALGHTVIATVSTAAEAIEQARDAEVVLMDVRLDGPVDGIEAAQKIRERYRVPVLFLTAHADSSTLERAKLAEPFGYLLKPLANGSLHTGIEIAMHKYEMERQLEESETWLRATLTSVADAVIVTDPQGQIRILNPAAEALSGSVPTAVSQLFPEDPVPLAILQDAPVPIYAQLAEHWVEGSAVPLKASGEVIGGVVVLRNITAARLAAGVANDFANLIAVIQNQCAQLLRQFADYSPLHKALQEIQQATLAADRITQRLTDLGTQPAGQLEVLSLNGILRRMSKFIQSIAGDHIAVAIHPSAGMAKIYADAAQTEELILKLVLHAVKALRDGGQLSLETAADGDCVSLAVTHTGDATDVDNVNLSLVRYLTSEGNRLEAFFPRWIDSAAVAGAPPTLLLIEPREHIHSRLHNFFEASGYNLLEACDDDQAGTLLDLHEVDLVIGGSGERDTVPFLRLAPPYTQQQLLEQVRALLDPPSLTFSAST